MCTQFVNCGTKRTATVPRNDETKTTVFYSFFVQGKFVSVFTTLSMYCLIEKIFGKMGCVQSTNSGAKQRFDSVQELNKNNVAVEYDRQEVQENEEAVLTKQCISSDPKKKFNDFCDVIGNNVAVDYGKQEVQNIQEAVLEMLER